MIGNLLKLLVDQTKLLSPAPVADPDILKAGGGIQCISPVVIYRFIAYKLYAFFYTGKGDSLEKILRPVGEGAAPPPPSFESATAQLDF